MRSGRVKSKLRQNDAAHGNTNAIAFKAAWVYYNNWINVII